jgi:hypothetical protein
VTTPTVNEAPTVATMGSRRAIVAQHLLSAKWAGGLVPSSENTYAARRILMEQVDRLLDAIDHVGPRPGDRAIIDGIDGVLVYCDACGGSGTLHRPVNSTRAELPPIDHEQQPVLLPSPRPIEAARHDPEELAAIEARFREGGYDRGGFLPSPTVTLGPVSADPEYPERKGPRHVAPPTARGERQRQRQTAAPAQWLNPTPAHGNPL